MVVGEEEEDGGENKNTSHTFDNGQNIVYVDTRTETCRQHDTNMVRGSDCLSCLKCIKIRSDRCFLIKGDYNRLRILLPLLW